MTSPPSLKEPAEQTAEKGTTLPDKEDAPEQDNPSHEAPPDAVPLPATTPHRSTRARHVPIADDDTRYEVTSYGHNAPNVNTPVGITTTTTLLQVNKAEIDENPQTYKEAMSCPDATQWQIACAEELDIFRQMKLYEIVDKPTNRKVVDSKWVFQLKRGPDGEIEKHKARVVAKGFTQIKGLDYDETFAPIVKFTSICILLAITAHNDLEIHQIDIKTAFLNGEIKEEIYLEPPPGANVNKALIWRLLKPLYGLKQAERQWYQKVHAKFTAIGFVRLEADHSIFRQGEGVNLILVTVYVDDMLIFSKLTSAIISFKEQLATIFPTTDLGEAHWILNMEIVHDRTARTITLIIQTLNKPRNTPRTSIM
jgi:hypothetical protein